MFFSERINMQNSIAEKEDNGRYHEMGIGKGKHLSEKEQEQSSTDPYCIAINDHKIYGILSIGKVWINIDQSGIKYSGFHEYRYISSLKISAYPLLE